MQSQRPKTSANCNASLRDPLYSHLRVRLYLQAALALHLHSRAVRAATTLPQPRHNGDSYHVTQSRSPVGAAQRSNPASRKRKQEHERDRACSDPVQRQNRRYPDGSFRYPRPHRQRARGTPQGRAGADCRRYGDRWQHRDRLARRRVACFWQQADADADAEAGGQVGKQAAS